LQVLRLDEAGAVRRLRIKRRDLLREHGLQPRDLRRIDPTIDFTKTSPSITIKEDVLLLNLGGIRCVIRLCVTWFMCHDKHFARLCFVS
jgi:magnesium transporter